MQYKAELRWLIFLIIPLIIMLIVNVAIPLALVLRGEIVFSDFYQGERVTGEETSIHSLTSNMAASASNFFGSLVNSQRTLSNLIANKKMKNIETISQSVGLNSAYAFSQGIRENSLELNTTQNTPMWFATNMSVFSQLTTK